MTLSFPCTILTRKNIKNILWNQRNVVILQTSLIPNCFEMRVPTLFKEYIWLIDTIWKARMITFAEINERWLETEMSGGVEMAHATFNRHKDAIEDIFGIYIDCDRRDGYRYYIGNSEVLREATKCLRLSHNLRQPLFVFAPDFTIITINIKQNDYERRRTEV